MEAISDVVKWAESHGVQLNGIAPKAMPGKGIGLVATRKIKPGETVLQVPTALLRTINTVPKSIRDALPADISVHGLLAADIAMNSDFTTTSPASSSPSDHTLWNKVLPTLDDFSTVPLTWPAELQALLPAGAAILLSTQKAKLCKDWSLVSAAFPNDPRLFPKTPHRASSPSSSSSAFSPTLLSICPSKAYLHAWLLVNTRTFYYVTPSTAHLPRQDHMALQPVADLFNHSPRGCNVSFDPSEGFSIVADRVYSPSSEITISYGHHSNDFLLAEYGFILPSTTNTWDETSLDKFVLPRLTERHRFFLEEKGYLGNYVLDAQTICYRTEVALRLLCSRSMRRWRRFVDGGHGEEKEEGAEEEGKEEEERDVTLRFILLEAQVRARENVEDLRVGKVKAMGLKCQREVLRARWEQIEELAQAAIERLG